MCPRPPLQERQILLLQALLEMKAFDHGSRVDTGEILGRSNWHASDHVFNLAIADLVDRDLIEDLNARNGGVWLTLKGKLLALTDPYFAEFQD